MVIPYMPMLVPPLNWTGYAILLSLCCNSAFYRKQKLILNLVLLLFLLRYERGAYLFLPSYIMRTHGAKQQREAVKRAPKQQLEPVFQVCQY